MSRFKNVKVTKRERALLTILIAEIEGCDDLQSVADVTQSWVRANDLHPEEVQTLTEEEIQAKFFAA